MSHNVTISGVEFTDLAVLKRAVQELAAEAGITAEFISGDNAYIRGWNGKREKVDHVVSLPHEHYDIGFRSVNGKLVPILESMLNARGFCANVQSKPLVDRSAEDRALNRMTHTSTAPIGRLIQRYAVCMAERNARNEGLSSRRKIGQNGQITLQIQ